MRVMDYLVALDALGRDAQPDLILNFVFRVEG